MQKCKETNLQILAMTVFEFALLKVTQSVHFSKGQTIDTQPVVSPCLRFISHCPPHNQPLDWLNQLPPSCLCKSGCMSSACVGTCEGEQELGYLLWACSPSPTFVWLCISMQRRESGECWRKQLPASIRWLVMNSQLTLNLFQEWPVNEGGCWGGGGGWGIHYLAANYPASAISILEIAVWLKGLVNQIDNRD